MSAELETIKKSRKSGFQGKFNETQQYNRSCKTDYIILNYSTKIFQTVKEIMGFVNKWQWADIITGFSFSIEKVNLYLVSNEINSPVVIKVLKKSNS